MCCNTTLQESIPVRCVPLTCQPYVWWPPLDVSGGVVPTSSPGHTHPLKGTWDQAYVTPQKGPDNRETHSQKGPGTRNTHPLPWKGHGTMIAHPPVNRLTDTENITFPQLLLRAVTMGQHVKKSQCLRENALDRTVKDSFFSSQPRSKL